MARRGIALISDEMELTVSTGVKKSGMIDVKKNTVVTVIEKNGLQEAGGASHIIFGGEYAAFIYSKRQNAHVPAKINLGSIQAFEHGLLSRPVQQQ